jgi:hypothetical protein
MPSSKLDSELLLRLRESFGAHTVQRSDRPKLSSASAEKRNEGY